METAISSPVTTAIGYTIPQFRIAVFGHRGVGKSTYLTALYAMLVNNTYRSVDFEYTDDDTAAKLAEYLNAVVEYYSSTKDWQLPPTISMPQELHFLLKRKGREYRLNLIDYRGESTTIGEMTQNKDLLDFFATCDGMMIFNANEADEEDRTVRRANHIARHQDLKYLFSSLKNRSGKPKLQIPVAMVYTKSDKIDFGTLSPKGWVEDNNSALMETLKNNVQTYRTVFLSSQMAFLNVMDNERFRLSETERSGAVVKCDADVAYPLFWLIDQIQTPVSTGSHMVVKKPSPKWWVLPVILLILIGAGAFWWINNGSIQDSKISVELSPIPTVSTKQISTSLSPQNQTSEPLFTADFTAVINDPDGFTNVRIGKSDKSKVIGRIMVGELFEVEKTSSNWWKIRGKESLIEGYMHKSRIKELQDARMMLGQTYTGEIGTYPISVYLEHGRPYNCDKGGNTLVGFYFYNKKGIGNKIRLKGYNCGAMIFLSEFDAKDNEIAVFNGVKNGDLINGTWIGVGKEFQFSIKETSDELSIKGVQSVQNSEVTHYVLPSRAYFYDIKSGIYTIRPNVFVIRGDRVKVIETKDTYYYVEYTGKTGRTTKGYLLINDLQLLQ